MRSTKATAAPLSRWVDELIDARSRAGLLAEIPTVDPADAGIEARVLLLMEAPGPMTNAGNVRAGSGFISSDNNDPTAENLWRARRNAGLLGGTLLWNAVPWYLGPASKKPSMVDLRDGAGPLRDLVALLPELHTVVTLGVVPRKGWSRFGRPNLGIGLRTIETWHPSQLAMNQAGKRAHLDASLARAARDWRRDGAVGREIFVDRDHTGAATAHWFINGEGDRVDVHPRWW